MGGGASSKNKVEALVLEKSDSLAGVPGVSTKLGRGVLKRDENDKFLYWTDLEAVGFEQADTPLKETQDAVRVVVDANNSLVQAVWTVQDALCAMLNICVFSIEDADGKADPMAMTGFSKQATKKAMADLPIKPVLSRKGRALEPYEIADMCDATINLSANQFQVYYEQFVEVAALMLKNQKKAPGTEIETHESGHSIMITKGENKMVLCSDMLRVNTVSYALCRLLIKDSIADEKTGTIGCMMHPMLVKLAELRDRGAFTSFHLVMAIFPDEEVVDGCVEFEAKPDPASMSELAPYKEVYAAMFGEDGLFRKLNHCLSLLKAASRPLAENPRKVLFLRDTKWQEVCKQAGTDEKQIPMIAKKIVDNLSNIRNVNVMAPACVDFVKTTFFDLHTAFREATLLPAEEVIEDLPAPTTNFAQTVVKLKGVAAAQDGAQVRGRAREAGEELPAACNAGPPPATEKERKKNEKKAAKKEERASQQATGDDSYDAAPDSPAGDAAPAVAQDAAADDGEVDAVQAAFMASSIQAGVEAENEEAAPEARSAAPPAEEACAEEPPAEPPVEEDAPPVEEAADPMQLQPPMPPPAEANTDISTLTTLTAGVEAAGQAAAEAAVAVEAAVVQPAAAVVAEAEDSDEEGA